MTRHNRRHPWAAIAGALALTFASLVSTGCGVSPITPARIEQALSTTFANRVHLQVAVMGLPTKPAPEYGVKARCRKLMGDRQAGSGEWACTVDWTGPEGQLLRDQFDLFVNTDGCFSANAEAAALGGHVVTRTDGVDVRNLLYSFDACFETT